MPQVQKMICLLHNDGNYDFLITFIASGEKYKNKVLSSVVIQIKTYFDMQNIPAEHICNN